MKRKIGSVLLSMAMIGVLLGGCGGPQASEEGNVPAEAQTEDAQEDAGAPAEDTGAAPAENTASAGGTDILSTGPNGEKATPASEITLTDEEIEQIRNGGYKAAISLHYGGNDWATSQLEGLKATFEMLGIELVATTDADFSAEQQVSDIETIMAKNPDVIISIPTIITITIRTTTINTSTIITKYGIKSL